MSIVQAKPARVRQTLSTKESALEFGLVSNCGRILQNLYSSFAFHSDGRLLNRMNAALLKSLKDTEKPRGERDLHDGNPQQCRVNRLLSGSRLVGIEASANDLSRTSELAPIIRR